MGDDPDIKKEAWRVIAKIFSNESSQTAIRLVGMGQVTGAVEKGLLSVSSYIRALSCQVFNNIVPLLLDGEGLYSNGKAGDMIVKVLGMHRC